MHLLLSSGAGVAAIEAVKPEKMTRAAAVKMRMVITFEITEEMRGSMDIYVYH